MTKPKRLIKRILVGSRIPQAWSRLYRPRLVILRYHSVVDNPRTFYSTIGMGIIHSTALFRRQMELVARKFNPLRIEDALQFIRNRKQFPRRAVVITFDDGYRDNYEIAAPILEYYGLRAAFYITTDPIQNSKAPWFCRLRYAFHTTEVKSWVDLATGYQHRLACEEDRREAFHSASRYCSTLVGERQESFIYSVLKELHDDGLVGSYNLMMDWDQIKELHCREHIIGSHTMTHPNLAFVSFSEACEEMRDSKQALEEKLGGPIMHFSYPSPCLQPHWTEKTVLLSAKLGYQTGVTCYSGGAVQSDNPLALPRVAVPQDLEEFQWIVEAGLAGRKF
jgi:peptidoglycan/xylan/chitin deacetylase (PgdA/CDA1 family)